MCTDAFYVFKKDVHGLNRCMINGAVFFKDGTVAGKKSNPPL